jgi:site-specific recombinase XerC
VENDKRIQVSKVLLHAGRIAFLVYDLEEQQLISEISDYAWVQLNDRQNSPLTVEQGLRHIVEFQQYLLRKKVRLGAVSDEVIRGFRDENLKKVLFSRAHRGSSNHAKATVNLKLSRIYDWLVWLQNARRIPVGTVGHQGLVTTLVNAPAIRMVRGGRWIGSARKFPLLFKVSDSNAKHNAPATVVLDKHVSDLFNVFLSEHDPFVAHRNILFADIAESAGFRRGSICSLTVQQFNLNAIEASKGEFLVRPSRQKFGYTNTLAISLNLAFRRRQFIYDFLIPWTASRELPIETHEGKLFLSSKTGKPMTERAMTQLVSKGFRRLGLDKGIGPHSLRGKFASEEADRELMERKELGLDTSNLSIAAAVSMKLGQKDPMQFYRYASSSQARHARIARDGKQSELKALREEVIRLQATLDEKVKAGS